MRDIQDAVEYVPAPVYAGPPAFVAQPYPYRPAPAMLELVLGAHPRSRHAPEVTVDGVPVARGWGNWYVPVAPGRHTVVLGCRAYGIMRKVRVLQCVVGSGCAAQVNYRLEDDGHARAWVGGAMPAVPRALVALVVAPLAVLVVVGALVLMMMLVLAAA